MSNELTAAERKTLDRAMNIILAHTPANASWSISANHWHGSTGFDVVYFDSQRNQHNWVEGTGFGDKIATALSHELSEEAKEAARLERVKYLRAELAALTDEAA